ncbi:hypothetical protein V6N12_074403 [Hibiscus sabdariffa]|uniref:Reverse transcriptase zinc-binding domain-containing protein n=1 Tax=Hibiscus sabdariffa TaxID=183260 RepID=A0ABR2BL18_9ROSI
MRSKRSTEKAIGRMHVCDAIAEVDKAKGPFKQCNKWETSWPFNSADCKEYMSSATTSFFKDILRHPVVVICSKGKDTLKWLGSLNGIFSPKAFDEYVANRGTNKDGVWKLIWTNLAPPKVEAFVWKTILLRISNVDMVSEIRLLTVVIFDLFVSSHLLPRVAGFIILIPSSPNVPVTLSSPSTPEPNNVHSFPVALASETNHNVFITESNPEVSPVVNVSNAPLRKSS